MKKKNQTDNLINKFGKDLAECDDDSAPFSRLIGALDGLLANKEISKDEHNDLISGAKLLQNKELRELCFRLFDGDYDNIEVFIKELMQFYIENKITLIEFDETYSLVCFMIKEAK